MSHEEVTKRQHETPVLPGIGVGDPGNFDGIDYNDPKAVANWARRMGDAAGVDLGPEYEEMVSQIGEGGDADAAGGFGDDLDF